jgi:hypothetical protein
MTEQTGLKSTGGEAAKAAEVAIEKRRRLLKLGVSAAPVVLTLASRSALACHCKSPSAAGSVTFNSHKPAGTVPNGQFEGTYDISAYVHPYSYWMGLGGTLAHTTVTKDTKLKDIPAFGTAFTSNQNTKIKDLPDGLNRDIVTAYLNLSNSQGVIQGECLTMEKLKAMASGTYTDLASGVTLNSTQIRAYLADNWLLG